MAAQVKVLQSTAKPAMPETLSERLQPYLAGIAKRAPAIEAARMVSAENIDIIREVGFCRAMVPAQFGGDQRDLWDYCSGVRTLSKACPSTGWVAGVLNVHPSGVCHFPAATRDAIWATGPDTIICSSGSA